MLIYHGLIFIFNKRWIWKVLEWWWIFRAKIYNKMLCMLQWNTRLLKTEITVFHVTFVKANEQKPTRGGATSPPKRVWMGWWWDYRYLWEIFLEWVPQWQQFDPGRAHQDPSYEAMTETIMWLWRSPPEQPPPGVGWAWCLLFMRLSVHRPGVTQHHFRASLQSQHFPGLSCSHRPHSVSFWRIIAKLQVTFLVSDVSPPV